jgi:hypothetical protein
MKAQHKAALFGLLLLVIPAFSAGENPPAAANRVFEWTIETHKAYADPFNDVDVDVVFNRAGNTWRVPTFWRGGNRWTVRFAPPVPGEYAFHLESTDRANPDLNGHEGRVEIARYSGDNPILRHGAIRVSSSRRYFEFADGTPFYWLGDTWWTGLSSRLSWEGFQKLAADRKGKGFTAIQIVAGLVPSNEEEAPSDPGFCNEGGCVWTPKFERINPAFFDYADRRVQCLLDNGLVPVIVGGWRQVLGQMGLDKMKKHWRYIIARYGAYPVLWLAGGEVLDALPQQQTGDGYESHRAALAKRIAVPGWTEVVRYIRETDPYHHPLSLHEVPPPLDTAISDESLTDFDLFQPGHSGWPSIATEVAMLDKHYARTTVTKPLVVGEVVYEELGGNQTADMERAAFWLGMLNGAAGFTYGNISTAEAYTADKPLHRLRWSLMTWDEAMGLPGSREVGYGANLLKSYQSWRFTPHPEWVSPRGTTLLEPNNKVNGFDIDLIAAGRDNNPPPEDELPLGEWQKQHGTFRLPYAAGIPGEIRVVYLPYFGFGGVKPTPTILGLEPGKRYHAFYWDPTTGTKFDLGAIELPQPGPVLFSGNPEARSDDWTGYQITFGSPSGSGTGDAEVSIAKDVNTADLAVKLNAQCGGEIGAVLRFHDPANYVAAVYSPREKVIYLLDRKDGKGEPVALTAVPELGATVTLSAEVHGSTAAVAITDGQHSFTSPIVDISNLTAGGAGVMRSSGGQADHIGRFEARQSSKIQPDTHLDRKLYDAEGKYRGEWAGPGIPGMAAFGWPGMDEWGKEKHVLLGAYRPERPPFFQDWVLVMNAEQ